MWPNDKIFVFMVKFFSDLTDVEESQKNMAGKISDDRT